MLLQRDEMDRVDRMALGRAEMSMSSKRMGEEQDVSSTRRSKRRKYQLLEEDWGMSGEESHNNFLYSGLEGVRRLEELDRNPSSKRKSGKYKALEIAAKDNHKLSEWIVKKNMNMVNDVKGLSKDPFSTGECMVQAECVINLDVVGKDVSHEVCAEDINNENSVIKSVDSKNVDEKKTKTKAWTKLRNGLFGWRVIRTGVRKTSGKIQTEAKLKTAKSGTSDSTIVIHTNKLVSPAEVLPGGNRLFAGNSSKRKFTKFEDIQHFGCGNSTEGGLMKERERPPDKD